MWKKIEEGFAKFGGDICSEHKLKFMLDAPWRRLEDLLRSSHPSKIFFKRPGLVDLSWNTQLSNFYCILLPLHFLSHLTWFCSSPQQIIKEKYQWSNLEPEILYLLPIFMLFDQRKNKYKTSSAQQSSWIFRSIVARHDSSEFTFKNKASEFE